MRRSRRLRKKYVSCFLSQKNFFKKKQKKIKKKLKIYKKKYNKRTYNAQKTRKF